MKSGIYKIVNIVNGKFYLGSSKDIDKRWEQHLYQLKANRHHSIHLQRAWNKYGEDSFSFEVMKLFDIEVDQKQLFNEEKKLLDELKPWNDSIGYNMSRTTDGGDLISYHPNKEEIVSRMKNTVLTNLSKMTESERKDRWSRPMEENPNWKDGATYFTCPICEKTVRSNKKKFQKTCRKCRSLKGENNTFYGKSHTSKSIEIISDKAKKRGNSKNIQKISVEIDGIRYSSFSLAAKALGCVVASIRNRLNNPLKFPTYKLIQKSEHSS